MSCLYSPRTWCVLGTLRWEGRLPGMGLILCLESGCHRGLAHISRVMAPPFLLWVSSLSLPMTTNRVDQNHRNVFSHSSGGQESKGKAAAGPCPPGSCRQRSLPTFLGFRWLSVILGVSNVHPSNLCLQRHTAFCPVCVCRLFSHEGMNRWIRATVTRQDLILTELITPAKIRFPNKITL